MTDNAKEMLTVIGFFAAFIGLVPYITDILAHKTKPHMFSWLIWSLLTGTAFFGQVADHGGPGEWVTGLNSIMCFFIFFLSIKFGEKKIETSDKVTFSLALCAIPLWMLTHTPLYSMILITLIDMLGFYSTFRKSWNKPFEETLKAFALAGLMYAFGVAALSNYTIVTTLYPVSLVITNMGFVFYVLWRRKVVAKKNTDLMPKVV